METFKINNRNGNHKKILSESLPIILLILCNIIFFTKILFSGNSLYGADFLYQFYPWKNFIYQNIWVNGHFPLWNPYKFSGSPFIANIQASMFYPLGFLYYIFPPEAAYLYSTMMHCMLGAIFMYLFMRSISISRVGSLLSAIIFMFNGYFISHLYAGHLSFVQCYVWLPLIFLFWVRFCYHFDLKNAVIAGLLLGVQILGGFPQICFYTILAIIFFGLFILGKTFLSRSYQRVVKTIFGLCIIFLIGFGLAAIQILPTLEFTELSTRAGGVNYEFATYDSLHPKELLTFLLPEIFGNVVDGTYWRTPEGWHFWETCAYVGVIPFFLVLFKPIKGNARKLWIFFIVLIFVSLFLALGKYNPIYPVIYKIPGFNSFRLPAQIIYLYIFSIAILSGLGITRILDDGVLFTKSSIIFLTLIGIILIIFIVGIHWNVYDFFHRMFLYFAEGPIRYVNFPNLFERTITGVNKAGLVFFAALLLLFMKRNQKINFSVFSTCLFLLALMDIGKFGWEFIEPYDYSTSPVKQQIAARLNKKPSEGRVIALTPFNPNDGMISKFPSVLGYDPLILKRYAAYIQKSQEWPLNDHLVNLAWVNYPDRKLLKMLNVNRLVHMDNILDIENDIPYVNFITKAAFKKEEEILSFIRSNDFNPKRMVVFNDTYHFKLPEHQSDGVVGSYSVTEYDNHRISIKTSTDKPCFIVLSEIFYPGWYANVDKKDVPILRGNYLFRVIPISKGEHKVDLYYVSWPFRIGCFISLITLFSAAVFLLYRRLYSE